MGRMRGGKSIFQRKERVEMAQQWMQRGEGTTKGRGRTRRSDGERARRRGSRSAALQWSVRRADESYSPLFFHSLCHSSTATHSGSVATDADVVRRSAPALRLNRGVARSGGYCRRCSASERGPTIGRMKEAGTSTQTQRASDERNTRRDNEQGAASGGEGGNERDKEARRRGRAWKIKEKNSRGGQKDRKCQTADW